MWPVDAFWHFRGVTVDGGGFDGFGPCAHTFAMKSVSYSARIINACCLAHDNAGVDVVVVERDAQKDVDMREVVVPCEWMEERSGAAIRAEGEHNRGRGVFGRFVATAAAEGEMRGEGGTRRVLVRERGGLLAEGGRVKTGSLHRTRRESV
jgi:hypothetical protein